ncbi:hypothetical protein M3Y94_00985000 [Aphelenchoides besseyi]|nr:hypothetical protein M3Y94_00985000 [Aphelenchoides besseyi]KAI6221093.1 hypothetical protein M3Y95_01004600 [Aphelenchoides besseyi]
MDTRDKKPCAVCTAPARYVYYSAYVCKACTVFYRRTYKLLNTLKCRRINECVIGAEQRNQCRACRLKKCREVGLRMAGKNLVVQSNGYPVDDCDDPLDSMSGTSLLDQHQSSDSSPIDGSDHSSSSTFLPNLADQPTSSTAANNSTSALAIPELSSQDTDALNKYPHLKEVILAFRQLEQKQRFLSAMHQERDLLGNETEPLTVTLLSLMENATLRLACIFMADILAKCDLSVEQRMTILKALPVEISMAHKIGLASRVYPNQGDTRNCIFIGLFVDHTRLELFVDDKAMLQTELVRPMFTLAYQTTEKARKLQLDFVECAMLLGIVLFEALDRHAIVTNAVSIYRENLYNEFNSYLIDKHKSFLTAASRMMRLTALIYEVKTLSVTQEDCYTILNIFLPENRQAFWQIKPSVPQSNIENLAFATNDLS